MARKIRCGKIEEIIYARFEPGEDILQALYEICVEKDIKTGVILDGSGSAVDFTYQHFPVNPKMAPTNVVVGTMEGKCEISLQGTIGTTVCRLDEGHDQEDVIAGMFPTIPGVLGDNADKDYTVCGHLMPGTKVASGDPNKPSHFTVVIAKVSGVELDAVIDDEIGFYQDVREV